MTLQSKDLMKVGDFYYRVSDLNRYQVVSECGLSFYLCHFDGDCSAITHVSKKMPADQFQKLFSTTRAEAADLLAEFYEESAANIRKYHCKVGE